LLHRERGLRRLARRLRIDRPTPSVELLRVVSASIPVVSEAPDRRRTVFAASITAVLVLALSLLGGASYAANSITHVVKAAAKIVTPKTTHGAVIVQGLTASGDQYQPGFGFGDPNHNHDGPPGLSGKDGEKTPPAQTATVGKSKKVVTRIRVDEQAALYISVLDDNDSRLVLNQNGSKVGTGLSGKQVKTIHYVVLVPRSIPIQLLVPKALLVKGQTYRIHVIAIDSDGNKSSVDIPFVA
jgi:hypothetical protein